MNKIVFFSDKNMLPGLHAALVSLTLSFKGDPAEVIVFCDNIKPGEKQKLVETWQSNNNTNLTLTLQDMPAIMLPPGTDTLHGNITTYGRLFLGDWLSSSVYKVVYLDADIIIKYNIQQLFDAIADNYTLYVDGTGKRSFSWDKDLYKAAGLSMDGECFNAGILGLNLSNWRKYKYKERCIEIMIKYKGLLKAADQSVLNIVFADNFCSLGTQINTQLNPEAKKDHYQDPFIYHFVGSPKPFDAFAKHIHNSFDFWYSYFKLTSIKHYSFLRYTSIKRLINIRRSIARALINTAKQKL